MLEGAAAYRVLRARFLAVGHGGPLIAGVFLDEGADAGGCPSVYRRAPEPSGYVVGWMEHGILC